MTDDASASWKFRKYIDGGEVFMFVFEAPGSHKLKAEDFTSLCLSHWIPDSHLHMPVSEPDAKVSVSVLLVALSPCLRDVIGCGSAGVTLRSFRRLSVAVPAIAL